MPRALRLAAPFAALALLAAAPAAGAASRLVIRGAGWGHGVGMSQWGAYGFALNGWGHQQILAHYYTGTTLGQTDSDQPVRVLIASRGGVARFTGVSAAGTRTLRAAALYGARARADGRIDLLSPKGRRQAIVAAPLTLDGPGPIALAGVGVYRGTLTLYPAGRGFDVVNTLGLEDYVRGVVARESPSTWPLEALEAQAVAARTYAITTSRGGATFDQYADTRSQVYGGVAAETPSTDLAVGQTRGEVVAYGGTPVTTYFFSTSGGRTEDVENAFGGEALPWLRSVDDPYDGYSPRHRWGPTQLTLKQAAAKLRGLVPGSFKGIKVVARGESPRIISADVIGSRGRTRVSGSTLRARLGLYDTWAFFKSIGTTVEPRQPDEDQPQPQQLDVNGGSPARMASRPPAAVLTGTILPGRAGTRLRVERRHAGRWSTAAVTRLGAGGRYRVTVRHPGAYRVRAGADAGPAVRVR